MFLQTRALVVYGALLTLVMGAPATFTRGRLTKRMEAEGFNDVAHATHAKGGKIFTHEEFIKNMPGPIFNKIEVKPGESGLTLMEFREHAGHAMGVTDKHMDRFVNRYVIDFPRPFSMETKGDLQGLYEEHLAWLQPNKDIEDNSAQVLALKEKLGQIREKSQPNEEVALKEYWERLESLDEAGFSKEDQYDWYLWKAAQHWRSIYKDTEKLDIDHLVSEFMSVAKDDSRLKDNIYVKEWKNGNPEENETIIRLVEGLKQHSETLNATKQNRPWYHWRSLLDQVCILWKKMTKKFGAKMPGEKLE
ncbi:hypothetical protein Pst134EA_025421 [Puccinia striiformis f. sp. tritici]|uniref:hypothetical protein n=1 Tax=Puccinia striiformis f. sp. tritici TaxID=168172 RepID=UPI002007E8CC|nr:hypothetical protein Pst134EA_025421 [Puccinia striiformis f. sp. tritici]KAH9451467.1 hypothetical protein Pst134EA_025421 [Puccinia striiformis f. sp. tritici]